MKKANTKIIFSEKNRKGVAMIIVAVILVIGLTFFILQKSGVFNKKLSDVHAKGIMPWKEWKIRQKLEEQGDLVINEIAEIERSKYSGNARLVEDNSARGSITVAFFPSGVGGLWHGSYLNSKRQQCDIMGGEFSGKFYPDKIFLDEQGNEDISKHYFLCKGSFLIQETGKNIVKNRGGDIYVQGWYDDNKFVTARVFITSDEKNYHEFKFSGYGSI